MTTQDYLKNAVDNLRLAAQARKQEIDDLRHSISKNDQETKERLNNAKIHEAESLGYAAATDDNTTRAFQIRNAQVLRAEESKIQDHFNKLKRDIDAALNAKQRNLDDINRVLQEIKNGWMSL